MADQNDSVLLREYTERQSESAFRELVRRHLNFVYSVAMRYVGNPADAQDVAQAVFVILARKSARLCGRTTLTGWLYETTRLTARQLLRTKTRRLVREQEACMESTSDSSGGEQLWHQLSPHLEEAMSRLRAADRELLALRYYENKTGEEAAALLGIGAAAAHKRTTRALEKLQKFFAKRGVTSTTAAIAGAVSANSMLVAPASLTITITGAALAKGAAASTSTLTLINGALKIMAWTKAKTAIVAGTAAILTIGTGVFIVGNITPPGGSNGERGPVEMQMKWQAGKKYVIHRETTQTSETKQPNQPKPVKQVAKMTQDFHFTPVNLLDNGGRQLRLEFESLAVEVSDGSRKTFSADSARNPAPDANNPVGIRLSKMVGARLQYFINANGKVENMEGYQELVKRVAGDNPQEQAAFRSLFNENTLRQFGSIGEDTTPRRVVKLGDRWATRLEVPTDIGMLNLDVKLTFKNWEQHTDHKCMRIKFTGDYSLQAVPNTPNPPVKFEKTALSGEYWVDPELGMVVEMTFDADVTLKINQQTIRSDQKTRYTLLAVEDVAKKSFANVFGVRGQAGDRPVGPWQE